MQKGKFMKDREFQDKSVLVTGAASGLGRATALAFAREGAALCLVDLNETGLKATCDEIAAQGGRSVVFATDISEPANCARSVAAAMEAFGRLDALCNVAGIVEFAHLKDVTPERWNRMLAVNLTAPFFLIQAAMPHLLESHGAVVNVASAAAFRGQPYMTPYNASKAALVSMTKSLATEFVKQPVRINAIAPGSMMTGMVNTRIPLDLDPELMGKIGAIRPPAQPEDMTDLILYLASDRARAVHGATFSIDCGMTTL
jgi:NAD(P)-dependent dehydrogenase (short-subunit alcohol dehydrogenase family)